MGPTTRATSATSSRGSSRRCGHEAVSVAENGRELVEHCRELQPDLVITDVKMPGMDGIEALREICRERPVPVILVSAHPDVSFAERPEVDSILAYLVKPIGRDDLVPTIAIAMRRFEELQRLRQRGGRSAASNGHSNMIEQAQGILMREVAIGREDRRPLAPQPRRCAVGPPAASERHVAPGGELISIRHRCPIRPTKLTSPGTEGPAYETCYGSL